MNFTRSSTKEQRLMIMDHLKGLILKRAEDVDQERLFPYENIQDLKNFGYTTLTLPQNFGGKDISLNELVMLQERLAEGDGSTALSIGWHMGIIKNLTEKNNWPKEIYELLCKQVVNGALVNGAATERQTGSPTRGGKPATLAKKNNNGWIINGRKTFTTMAPVLDFFIVSATMEDGSVGNFLLSKHSKGVMIEETWDSIAMQGTGSHNLVLENVRIGKDYFVERLTPGSKRANGWLLHIPACYLGIAQAAQSYSIQFAKEYSPSSISGTISDLPNVQQKIGEMELLLTQSRHFLYSVANQWDNSSDLERNKMQPLLGAVKLSITNSAITVVDLAMRVVGARSLSIQNPLQRYYRDVRAGLHNPPMDDMTIKLLAESKLHNQF